MFHLTIVLLLSVLCHTTHGISKLPPYIKPCSQSVPNFNECAIKNGREALSTVVKGDPKYHIPCLDPLKLDKISLQGSDNLQLYAEDLQLIGLKSAEIMDIDWNLNSKTIKIEIHIPEMRAIGQYNLDGRVLIMNLKGTGRMNNTHYNCQILMNCSYDVYNRKDKEYIKITNITIEFLNEKSHFQFSNLLNNQQISDQMNSFLNENSEVVVKETMPSINKVIQTVTLSVLNPLVEKIPLEEIVTA
ncbi:takeout [Carabus blaptoides fortunei]